MDVLRGKKVVLYAGIYDFDFLVPKAGYFCQICSSFFVDEESMRSHCQTPLHQQNMEKFTTKSPAEPKAKEDTEEESLA